MEHIDYIKNNDIGMILSKGLASVYEEKPEKPIDFLAKWLLTYSGSPFN